MRKKKTVGIDLITDSTLQPDIFIQLTTAMGG
jgi:hypothetical protein